MAYQNVGVPRFYLDTYQYLKSNGLNVGKYYNDYYSGHLRVNDYDANPDYGGNGYDFTPLKYPQVFDLNPKRQFFFGRDEGEGNDSGKWFNFVLPFPRIKCTNKQKVYAFILNHTLYNESLIEYNGVENALFGMYINFMTRTYPESDSDFSMTQTSASNRVGVVNTETAYPRSIYNNGFSLQLGDPVYDDVYSFMRIGINYDGVNENNVVGHWVGGVSGGFYYDMPNSPDLEIELEIQNDGFKSITTQGGSHLNQINYNGTPDWTRVDHFTGEEYNVPAWTIGEPSTFGRRRGRRSWSLKFSYFSEEDLFASNYITNTYTQNADGYNSDDLHDVEGNDTLYYNLENDDSFHAQVLNRIGNNEKFIFQADNTNFNQDQFAICQLDQDSLVINQVSNGTYEISFKILEVW